MLPPFENDLIEVWTTEMQKIFDDYKEPLLDENTMNIIKMACNTFKQDIHVFITAVDVLEKYITVKSSRNEKILDEVLTLTCSIFLTSKYCGGGADLKVCIIEKFLYKITNVRYNTKDIISAEIEILGTLDQVLPIRTIVDDLNIILEKYLMNMKLKAKIRPLCLEILELLYIRRKTWFFDLKELYSRNKEAMEVFELLVRCKHYLPASILISAFHLTYYQNVFNIESMVEDLMDFTKIHTDHLNILTTKILEMVSYQSNIDEGD